MAQKVSTVNYHHKAFLENRFSARKLDAGAEEFRAKEALRIKK
jgi:hypothetical protein